METKEKVYNIPLRKEVIRTMRYRRAKRAVHALMHYLVRHTKATEDKIRIGRYLNMEIWKNGKKNPPMNIKVSVITDEKGFVNAELVGAPKEVKAEKKETKKRAPKKEAAPEENKEDAIADGAVETSEVKAEGLPKEDKPVEPKKPKVVKPKAAKPKVEA